MLARLTKNFKGATLSAEEKYGPTAHAQYSQEKFGGKLGQLTGAGSSYGDDGGGGGGGGGTPGSSKGGGAGSSANRVLYSSNMSETNVKRSKRRRFNNLFNSDCEDELTSVVSDNPNLYARSCSMNNLQGSKVGKNSTAAGGVKFDKVEAKMLSIQESLRKDKSVGKKTKEELLKGRKEVKSANLKEEIDFLNKQIEERDEHITRLKNRLNEPSSERSKKLKQLIAKKEKKEKNIAVKKVRIQQARLHKDLDSRIIVAELEYSLERDQIEIMELINEIKNLEEGTNRKSFHRVVGQGTYQVVVTQGRSLRCLTVSDRGLEVTTAEQEDSVLENDLKEGDIVLEVCGEWTLGISQEEWSAILNSLSPEQLKQIVLLRKVTVDDCESSSGLSGLREDIALIQSRLEQKLVSSRALEKDLERANREKSDLASENTRLNHRIYYLEDQVSSLQKSFIQIRDSLSKTLNCKVLETLGQIEDSLEQNELSESTSGVYSDTSSGSPHSDGARTRHRTRQINNNNNDNCVRVTAHRWSIGDYSASSGEKDNYSDLRAKEVTVTSGGDSGHVITCGQSTDNVTLLITDSTSHLQMDDKDSNVARSASRVTGNLVRWPLSRPKIDKMEKVT